MPRRTPTKDGTTYSAKSCSAILAPLNAAMKMPTLTFSKGYTGYVVRSTKPSYYEWHTC